MERGRGNVDFFWVRESTKETVHTHAGRLKGAQPKKIAGDILKMLLHDQVNQCKFEKYIVVCAQEEHDQLTGNSALAEAIRQFHIHVLLIPLNENERKTLQAVMKKQNFL